MIVPLGRALTAAEAPTLAAHGLTMWGYVVLLRLQTMPVRTQAALAAEIGADKTRIIAVLDQLQRDGLITREADPADRRGNLLALTAEGRRRCDSAQAAIQANEQRVLAGLGMPAADVEGFLRVLHVLSRAEPDSFLPDNSSPEGDLPTSDLP
ncbi:MarR family winged helix-turn-helix transcriptional regulator [Actinospica acidithermotolerans]